jgi:hypothetical protein
VGTSAEQLILSAKSELWDIKDDPHSVRMAPTDEFRIMKLYMQISRCSTDAHDLLLVAQFWARQENLQCPSLI